MAIFGWGSDQLFAINHDLRDIRSPSLFSSLSHSLTAKESDLPCFTQERDRNVAGAESYLQQNDQTFFCSEVEKSSG